MAVLVYVEHDNASLKDATLAVVTAASQLGEVHALVAGHNCGAVADAAAKIAGVAKVHVADNAAYANQLAENVAPLVADEITELTGNTLNDSVTDHDGHILREFDTPLTSLSCVLIFPSGFWRKFMQPGPGRGLQSEIGKDG